MGGMTEYRRSTHTLYNIQVHIVWITKYRYKVMRGKISERVRELVRRICTESKAEILSGVVSSDHVHILVSIDPSISISKLVRYIKGKTSRKVQVEFPELKKRCWGQHLWARGYFCVSVGNVTAEMIKRYIENHDESEMGEDPFRVES
jgi:putative transposase